MKKYPTYKSSGIEWIGDIPEHWGIKKVKYLINKTDGIKIGPFGSSIKLDTLSETGIKIYGQGNIIKDDFTIGDRYLPENKFIEEFSQYEILDGDVLITMMGTTGKSKVFSTKFERGILDSHLLRLRFNNNLFDSFLFTIILENGDYVFHQLKLNSKGSIMEGLNSSIVKELNIITPPIHEQHQIIKFLDEKTDIIDKLISTKERKIDLLKEQRTSLINQVITKGLNPNVKMKDSGVEWIGDIPEHWETSKLGFYTTKIGSGSTPRGGSEVYVDSGIPFIRSQNVHFEGLRLDDISFIDTETHNSMKGTIVKKNDVLLNITGGSIGRCCIVYLEDEMNINQHVSIIRTTKDLTPFFLNYILYSDIGQSQVVYNVSGGNREGLTIEGIRNFKIVLPPIPEQNQIVDYLDNRTKEIDDLMSLEQKKIEVLKEYRQSLISEIITGKIDVRTNVN